MSFRARSSSGAVVRNGLLGAPSAVAPALPSAMDHDDERSLSLGTELSASVPPPSPLTGCYLLAVIGEPHTHEHKEIILQRLVKGQFLTLSLTLPTTSKLKDENFQRFYLDIKFLRIPEVTDVKMVFSNSPATSLLSLTVLFFFIIVTKHTFSFCFAEIKMWESLLIVIFYRLNNFIASGKCCPATYDYNVVASFLFA